MLLLVMLKMLLTFDIVKSISHMHERDEKERQTNKV